MAKKVHKSAARVPVLRVEKHPPVLNGAKAMQIAGGQSLELLVNSDIWRPAHDVSRALFADYLAACAEHAGMQHLVCGDSSRLFDLLEQSEWTQWRRLLQAAYVLGITVGQRQPGAR